MIWLIFLVLFLYLLYRYSTSTFGKYEAMGVHAVKPWPLLGSYPGALTMAKSPFDAGRTVYDDMGGRRYGMYYLFKDPTFVVCDPEMVRRVLVKDFDHFVDRVGFDSLNKVCYVVCIFAKAVAETDLK